MDERECLIKEEGSLKKYRTEIPNTVIKGSLSKKLSVYDFSLYAYLKSVAGESGACWQSTSTISEGLGISAGKVSECKRNLVKYGLINVKKGDRRKGHSDTITIKDIWVKNMNEFRNTKTPSSNEHPPSPSESTPSCDETTPSPHEAKKNPNKEEPYKEKYAREDLEKIYNAYPRDLKKESSIRAIKNALIDITDAGSIEDPLGFLLGKVKLFARAKKNVPLKYITHPDNWFSNKRYNDDPKEWNPKEKDESEKSVEIKIDPEFAKAMEVFRQDHISNDFEVRDKTQTPPADPKFVKEMNEKFF